MPDIFFSQPIPIKDINKLNFINITFMENEECKIEMDLSGSQYIFFGYTGMTNLLGFYTADNNYDSIKNLLEFFIINFNVLFFTNDEHQVIFINHKVIFKNIDIEIEKIHDNLLKKYKLQKYLRYKKLKKWMTI